MPSYWAYNGPAVTTGSYAPVTTGTAIKTMLQIQAPAAIPIVVWKWGIDFDGTASSAPVKCELIETGTVGATVTAHVASGIVSYAAAQSTSQVQLGTTGSGYTATAEGTITATRYATINSVAMGNGDRNEWSLGREFFVPAGRIIRIRVLTATAVNCACFMAWDE